MKIVVAHEYYQQPGGEDVVFQQEVELLKDAGHTVLTYTQHNDEINRYSSFRKAALIPNTVWSFRSKNAFVSVLEREKPDVVHLHNTFPLLSPSVYAACSDRHIPVIQTLHNFRLLCPSANLFRDNKPCEECVEHSLIRGIVHGCYRTSRLSSAAVAAMIAFNRARQTWTRLVDCYIACSDFARSKFVQAGLPAERIWVKPNFVSPDPGPRTGTGDYGLYVGRLSSEKGIRTLIDAWNAIPRPLRIIGDGPLYAEMKSLAGPHITFMGRLSRPEVIRHVKGARFVVFPSHCYENFPMAVVESFSCGVPVIASRLGSTAEIVRNEFNGLTFTPGDVNGLSTTIRWAIEHPGDMSAMGLNARREYERAYTSANNYKILMNVYEAAIRNRSGVKALQDTVLLREIA